MTQELQNAEQSQALSDWMEPKKLVSRLNRLKEIQRQVMKQGTHYGKIPGCSQDSLWQPGSQVLNVAFGLGQEPVNIEEFRDENEIRYRVTTRVFLITTGTTIAYGVGECSSSEDKYAWRRPKGVEWDNTAEDRRRIKYTDDSEIKQVRTNPADVSNTILKMATKRAEIKGTINALAASEVFTQDIEDLPEGMDLERKTRPSSTKPAVNPDDVKPVTNNQKIGVLTSVTSKPSGNGTRYSVTIDGKPYGTFSDSLGKAAGALRGKTVSFTTVINGKYENLESVSEYLATKQPAECPESISRHSGDIPDVESAESFASTIIMLGAQKGLTEAKLAGILEAEFSCGIDTVPAECQQKVIDHIKGL